MEVDNSSQVLRFVLDGKVVAIDRPPATMTVLEYLRDVACRRGTKEGCAEGDCGACTVVVGELSAGHCQNPVTYRAVNSCIRFLPTLDGKELITVESLAAADAPAHPVQRHRFPASAPSICSRSAWVRFKYRANSDMTKPGVQNPHCEAWLSISDCWTG